MSWKRCNLQHGYEPEHVELVEGALEPRSVQNILVHNCPVNLGILISVFDVGNSAICKQLM